MRMLSNYVSSMTARRPWTFPRPARDFCAALPCGVCGVAPGWNVKEPASTTPSRAPENGLQKNMSSSESTLKCAYGAGTSRGCQPAITGTNEHRENPECGTFPDWNVWCIGGAV